MGDRDVASTDCGEKDLLVIGNNPAHGCWHGSGSVSADVLMKYFANLNCSFDDVNISALLSSFQVGYDKRVRPNYGGE